MKKININVKKIEFDARKIQTNRTNDFCTLSGSLTSGRLQHHPFIVLNMTGKNKEILSIEIVNNADELIRNYSVETKVLAQWPGRWRSDFFSFTVGDIKLFKLLN